MKIVICTFVFFGFVFSCFAQDNPRSVLIDAFGYVNCDEMLTHIDNFALELNRISGTKGIAVFYPKNGQPGLALRFRGELSRGIAAKRFGKNPPKLLFGTPQDETKVEYWVVPPNAKEPELALARPDEIFADVQKPFLYNTEFGGEICPAANPQLMADLLRFNQNVDLKMVVRSKSLRYRNRKTRDWLHRLVTIEKIPRRRIRVVLSTKLEDYFPYQDVEFSFVPKARS